VYSSSWENSHQFISKKFENFSLYGQIDGMRDGKVLEQKTRMRYFYVGQHDMCQLATYMIIKERDGILFQDLKGQTKDTHYSLADMKIYMAPILKELHKVSTEIHGIFANDVTKEARKLLRFRLLNI